MFDEAARLHASDSRPSQREKALRLAGYSGLWALSICRPGANLVAAGVRSLTCRPFGAPAELVGRRIAIHARLYWNQQVADIAARLTGRPWTPADCPAGILGTVLLLDCGTVDDIPEAAADPWDRSYRFKWITLRPELWPVPAYHKGRLSSVWPVPPELVP